MSECLRHMREKRQYISILCPYSIPFYRKMGWEVVSDKLSFHIKDTQLPRRKPVRAWWNGCRWRARTSRMSMSTLRCSTMGR